MKFIFIFFLFLLFTYIKMCRYSLFSSVIFFCSPKTCEITIQNETFPSFQKGFSFSFPDNPPHLHPCPQQRIQLLTCISIALFLFCLDHIETGFILFYSGEIKRKFNIIREKAITSCLENKKETFSQ